MKKSQSHTSETQQRAADILSMIRAAAKKNYRTTAIELKPTTVTVTDARAQTKKLKRFLKSMHQL